MSITHWFHRHTETRGIYTVELHVADEFIPLRNLFDPEDVPILQRKLEYGEAVHFMARVTVSINGIKLGEYHLGSCFYKDYKEFYEERNGYYDQMVDEAIDQARDNLFHLQKAIAHTQLVA